MRRFEIEILHSIRGRMRLKLSCGLADPAEAFRFISARGGVKRFTYNPVLQTATIEYANHVRKNDLLVRTAVACVYGCEGGYAHIYDKRQDKPGAVMPSGWISLAMTLANIGAHLLLPASAVAAVMKWVTIGVTGYAIIEHGYKELHERGSFDPEVMSVVYLFDTINQGTYYAPLVAWALTFGRHLLQKNEGSMGLRIDRDERNPEDYIVEPVNRDMKEKLEFLSEFSTQCLSSAGQLPGAGNGPIVVSGGVADNYNIV